ncbi:MAG: response regulator [Pseudomonadota bacterium]
MRSFRETISTRMPVTLLLSSTDAAIAIASDKLAVPGLGLLREGAGIWHLCHQPIFSSDSRISGIVTYLTTLGLLDKTCEQLALTGLQSSVPVATVTGGKKVVATDASRLKIPPAPLAASTLKNFKDEEGKHRASIRCLQILLVEDNEDLRITAGEHLRLLGHEVTAAPDAERAQQYLAEGTFDLLFTDLTLPKMTGADLARWALRDFPQMQVVITSGYGRAMADVNDLDAFFLPKPYQRADLENLLARVDPR